MFKEIKDFLSSKSSSYRGWRILIDNINNYYYLSKFDDQYNEDEYRFILKEEDGLIKISRYLKIKNYNEPKDIKKKKPNINITNADKIVAELNSNRLVHN